MSIFRKIKRFSFVQYLNMFLCNIYIMSTLTGIDNLSYTSSSGFLNIASNINGYNFYGTNYNDGTSSTYFGSMYYFTSGIPIFTNNKIILAAGGNSGQNGGSAIYNTSGITTLSNYGALLGGGGGGGNGSKGGVGGGGGSGGINDAVAGSLITTPTTGGGGGPTQNGGQFVSYPQGITLRYTGGLGGGNYGGNGNSNGNGYDSPGIGGIFNFGGGGGAWNSEATAQFGASGGGYGGGNAPPNTANGAGGGGGGGGLGGIASANDGGHGGYSIYNTGTITTLNNSQGGTSYIYGPLFYAGVLPTNYNIKINSASSYGQLYCGGAISYSGNMIIALDSTSVLSFETTYVNVIYGVNNSNIANYSTISDRSNFSLVQNIKYFWFLEQTSTSPYTYNLVINTTNTILGLDTVTYSLLTSSFTNQTTNIFNYAGIFYNDGTSATSYGNIYNFTSTISSFTNTKIILASGGNSGQNGGSAIYNISSITTLNNYGALLGGGGGGGGGGSRGGIGGGGGAGNVNTAPGGSLLETPGTGAGGGPRQNGGASGGLGGGSYGGGGSFNTPGENSTYFGTDFNFGGGGGGWNGGNGSGGGGYGGGDGGVANNNSGGGGGGGGKGGYNYPAIPNMGGNGGYSIYNNIGIITILNNSQGGTNYRYGPLFYAGVLPTNYNITIKSASLYGQIYCGGAINYSGKMIFGLDPASILDVGTTTTYKNVIYGINSGDITNYSTISNTSNSWYLVQRLLTPAYISSIPYTYDLVIKSTITFTSKEPFTTSIITDNSSNYYGTNINYGNSSDNSGNFFNFITNATLPSFTNSGIILAAGGGSIYGKSFNGGNAIYIETTYSINNLYNYGYLLGGGGGGNSDSNGGRGFGGIGGAGGGGGGRAYGPGNGGGGGSISGTGIGGNGDKYRDDTGGNGGGGPGGYPGGTNSVRGNAPSGGYYNNGNYTVINVTNVIGEYYGGGYGGGSGNGGGGGGGGGGYSDSGGNGGYSIYNKGTITNLYNSQGGSNSFGPLFYGGTSLPTNYFITVNSINKYGQLFCSGWSTITSGTFTNIQIDPTSSFSGSVNFYPTVLVGNCFAACSGTIIINSGNTGKWSIVQSSNISIGTLGTTSYKSYDLYVYFSGTGIITASSLSLSGYLNSYSATNQTYINTIGSNTITTSTFSGDFVSLNASYIIASGSGFTINSDQRIKKNIQHLSSTDSLQLVKTLKPASFQYIDFFKGIVSKYGYLAQEVESVLPTIVNKNTAFIPNIFEIVKIKGEYNKVILNEKNTESLQIGTKIQFYDNDNIVLWREVQEIIDEKTFIVTESFLPEIETLFLYGQEVTDYRSIDTDQINTILLSALQECNNIIEKQDKKIDDLDKKIDDLEKKMEKSK